MKTNSRFFCLLSFLLTLISAPQALAQAGDDEYEFIPAKRISYNDDPVSRIAYTETEGWTWVNFAIDSEGNVKDILLIDHSEKTRFIDEAIEFVEQFKYSPASINGTPVESSRFLFLRHKSNKGMDQNKTAGESFAEDYGVALGYIARNELDTAAEAIEDLKDDFTFNLARQAWISWLNAMLSFRHKDYPEYLRHLQIGYYLTDPHLSNSVAAKLYMNLFEMQMYANLFVEAEETLQTMIRSDRVNLDDDLIESLTKRVDEGFDTTTPYSVELTLRKDKWQFYKLIDRGVDVQFTPGTLSGLELRCEGSNTSYMPQVDAATESLRVESDDVICALFVKGNEGAKATLLVTPDAY